MIHGDDCDAHRRRSFCVCTVCGGSPFDSKILLYAVDNSRGCTETFDTLDTWVVWSLIEIQEGRFMTVDPWQNPIERPDKQIAGPYRGVLVNLKGDEKWIQKVLKLKASWVSEYICPLCRASKSNALIYTRFGKCAPHRSTLLNTRQFIEDTCRPGAWLRLPGFHIDLITFDWLHVVDLAIIPECSASVTWAESIGGLGLNTWKDLEWWILWGAFVFHCSAKALIELTESDIVWQGANADARLRCAFVQFRAACKAHRVSFLVKCYVWPVLCFFPNTSVASIVFFLEKSLAQGIAVKCFLCF